MDKQQPKLPSNKARKAASEEPQPQETPQKLLYNPADTEKCSDAFFRFISEYDKIVGLFFFTVNLAAKADEVQRVIQAALQKVGEPVKPVEGIAFKTVKTYSSLLSRNLVTSMANNLLCYISEIVQQVVKKRHEILRSSEKLTTEEVLQFKRISDIVAFMADRKINELSYGGLREMQEFVADRLGVEMFKDDKERMLLTILVELRNIHTHNRGIVNKLFLNRIGCNHYDDFQFELGQLYHVNLDRFATLSRNAIAVAIRLDDRLAAKFKVKRFHYKKRLAKERGPAAGATRASATS
jgi:hypothetical protein